MCCCIKILQIVKLLAAASMEFERQLTHLKLILGIYSYCECTVFIASALLLPKKWLLVKPSDKVRISASTLCTCVHIIGIT